jgi:hypothetical protein
MNARFETADDVMSMPCPRCDRPTAFWHRDLVSDVCIECVAKETGIDSSAFRIKWMLQLLVIGCVRYLFPVLGAVLGLAVLLFLGLQWLSLLVWCLPLTLTAITVVLARRNREFTYLDGAAVSVGAILCLPCAIWVTQNAGSLPSWLLFALALPLNPNGSHLDSRGGWTRGWEITDQMGVVACVSFFGTMGLIGAVYELTRNKAPKSRTPDQG